MKKTRQQQTDEETLKRGLATGADQRGGQDKLDTQRRQYDDGPHPDTMFTGRKSIMGPLEDHHRGK